MIHDPNTLPRPSRHWQTAPSHCRECGARVSTDLDLEGEARCSSCATLFDLAVAALPTSVLTRWEGGSPSTHEGPSASFLCQVWRDVRTDEIFAQFPVVPRHREPSIVPCTRLVHVDDGHAWDVASAICFVGVPYPTN